MDSVFKERLTKIIYEWASKLPYEIKVYLFGSHLKGTAKADSDLDIAVEFLEGNIDPFLLWFDVHTAWQNELSRKIGIKVDLQLYEGDESPNLKKYLEENSLLVYHSEEP